MEPNTIRAHLAMVSSFSKWLVSRDRLVKNPVDQLVRPKRQRRPPRGIPAWRTVDGLLSNGLPYREKAIVALMAYGGLRRAEVVALDIGDFDPDFGLRRVKGKGGTEEAVALPGVARSIIAAYLAAGRKGARSDEPMFVCRYLTVGIKSRIGRMAEGRVYKIVSVSAWPTDSMASAPTPSATPVVWSCSNARAGISALFRNTFVTGTSRPPRSTPSS
jgi:site-specific recombinase XerC